MQFPAHFQEHLAQAPGYVDRAFEEAHHQPIPTSIRINPFKPADLGFPTEPIPWSSAGRYLPARPSFTFDPLFHAGAYYVQEASSQLIEQVWKQHVTLDRPIRILDLCAAPGGKSTHLLSLMREEDLLVSNEVIRSRSGILADNLARWGKHNVVVTQADPSVIGKLTGFFDVIVVDAPCSGSGLFRKDPDAMDHWSLSAVEHCAARQKRILADIWSALRAGGILIYSTCSFSEQEDEAMTQWMLSEWDATFLSLQLHNEWGITESNPGYRCWPHLMRGEGFFLAAVQKGSGLGESRSRIRSAITTLSSNKRQTLESHWSGKEDILFEWKESVWALPPAAIESVDAICSVCDPLRIGTCLGSWVRTDLIPDHALGLSIRVADSIPRVDLSWEEAIRYLQRGTVARAGLEKGWLLATFQRLPLGWMKSLGSRINNYYPSHLRILKQTIQGPEEKNAEF